MNYKSSYLKNSLLILPIILMMCKAPKEYSTEQEKTYLISADTLPLFDYFIADSTVGFNDVWQIKDSVIYCTGNPYGYLVSKDTYSDYVLHIEWRWSEEPGNSGVLLHTLNEQQIWPTCIEAQLWNGNAGDFVSINYFEFNEREDTSKYVVVKKQQENVEKPAGEWNSYDIHCLGDSVLLWVNDVFVNKATGVQSSNGHIGLQSEGKPIEFRNVYLVQK